MLSKTLLTLAAASLIQDVIALAPRQHAHQHLHEKRAVVTEVVTETAIVYVTMYEDQAPSSQLNAKKFYTHGRKRPFPSQASAAPSVAAPSVAAPSAAAPSVAAPSAPVTLEAIPRPSIPSVPVPSIEVPAAPPAPEPVPETPAAPPSQAPSGARGRGLAYNNPGFLGRFLGSGSRISWTYNWAQLDDSGAGVEFVPMCWGTTKGFPATWAANAQKMISAGSKALFSFNEPDHKAQANLSPQQAAASHIELMNPFQGKALIGTPSITNSNLPGEGIPWLQSWFEACGGRCAADFVNIHIYGVDTRTFLNHLLQVNNLFGKPVWITEFAFGGSDDEINSQLHEVIDQIENNSTFSFVHRYSYFMAAEGIMVRGNSMSTYGNTFAYGA